MQRGCTFLYTHARASAYASDIYGAGDTRMETNAQDSLRYALDNRASARTGGTEEKPSLGKNVPVHVSVYVWKSTDTSHFFAFAVKIFREYAPRVPPV